MGKKLVATGIAVAASIALTGCGFIGSWAQTGVDVISPENVKAQHETVIGKYNAMLTTADNACTVQEAGEAPGTNRSATLVESPTLAYEATFRNARTGYNNAVDNLFKAKIVAPPGYPKSVNTLDVDTDDWCTVSEQIRALRD